ncbi:photosystem II reaction center W protein, chloroplastic [Macadamia integrifolia]|uniref:photosystem II reaction center W protein, chloroplastic n=1 Tax=Macadamia integrifolia TaxID=60698 RepID=UPI001C4E3AE6|nr:photosystem II reaction center W protein, chloroplastic [Macadamia integrifolia]
MATLTASNPTSLVVRTAGLVQRRSAGAMASPVLGLPVLVKKGRVVCSMEEKPSASNNNSSMGMTASLVAAATAAAMSSPAALALVDDRMTTEGTGLPFGLSNNVLGWILLGVFALIWALYTVYTSTLDDDEESGLSL